jgi:hypothetical protein
LAVRPAIASAANSFAGSIGRGTRTADRVRM